MSPLRAIYLALAVWGAVHPGYWYWLWFSGHGLSLAGLIEAWRANAATRALGWDMVVAATALAIWAVAETRVRRNWTALWAIPATLFVGLGCGLPLYLFLRTRPIV